MNVLDAATHPGAARTAEAELDAGCAITAFSAISRETASAPHRREFPAWKFPPAALCFNRAEDARLGSPWRDEMIFARERRGAASAPVLGAQSAKASNEVEGNESRIARRSSLVSRRAEPGRSNARGGAACRDDECGARPRAIAFRAHRVDRRDAAPSAPGKQDGSARLPSAPSDQRGATASWTNAAYVRSGLPRIASRRSAVPASPFMPICWMPAIIRRMS